MVRRDPFFIVGLSSTCDSWAVSTNYWYSVLGFDFLATARGTLGALTTLAFSGEVGDNPDAVEEIDDSHEEGCKEEVEEDPKVLLVRSFRMAGGQLWSTYIWGSKMLVSGSTKLTVPLYACRV